MIKFEQLPPDILLRIPHLKRALLEYENIIFAYLFGGLAKGKLKPLSDVDIAVYVKDVHDLPGYKLRLFDTLTAILGTNELDLIILNTAPVVLSCRIVQNKAILVDKNPTLRHHYESLTLRKCFDFTVKEKELFSRRYGIG
jgi:predicted nucleotidyltransferase